MRRLAALVLVTACSSSLPEHDPGVLDFIPDRPVFSPPRTVEPYEGDEPLALEAQATYRTGLDLHRKLIMRSCGGANGVCHNQKEYPDMHTPAEFFSLIGAPCNVQPGGWSTVFDRCERLGDRFRFRDLGGKEIEIGWIDYIPGAPVDWNKRGGRPTATSPGLHVVLHDPVPDSVDDPWAEGVFIRTFVDDDQQVRELAYAAYRTRWWIIGDRRHLVADVDDWQADAVTSLLASGIEQGDMNRNAVYGARTGLSVSMLNPGLPEESYLIGRLRGHLQGEVVPGSRMPLANQPPSVPDMVALMCFVEGLARDTAHDDAPGPIDYRRCSYVEAPEQLGVVGSGVTWKERIRPMLAAHCGGCHGGEDPEGSLDLLSEGLHARLMGPSRQQASRKLVQPGRPDESYLYLKLSGDGSIVGRVMPVDPLGGTRQLDPADLEDLATWIIAGALEDG